MSMLSKLSSKFAIVASLAKSDFKRRYSGSLIGVGWAFFQPIVTILVFWFVFEHGVRSEPVADVPFLIWLISGLIPWFFFAEALAGTSNCVIEYGYLVKKVVFDVSLLPFIKLYSASMIHLIFIALLLVNIMCLGIAWDISLVQIFYYWFASACLALALASIFMSVMPFFRDLSQVIAIFLQFGMWLTPIMWDPTKLPSKFAWMLFLNPVAYIVNGYRDTVLHHKWFWHNQGQTFYFWILVGSLAAVGSRLFSKLRPYFADVL